MIYCLTGKIVKKSLNAVVLSCGGVGYYTQCPASVAGALPGVGQQPGGRLEQRGLAGTEVSGKHDDLHGFVGHVPSFVRHGLQLNLMPNACSYTHAPTNNTGYSQAPHTSGQ